MGGLSPGRNMLTFECPIDLTDRLTETARRLDMSRSALLRLTVLALVDREEAKAEATRIHNQQTRSKAVKKLRLQKRIDKLVTS